MSHASTASLAVVLALALATPAAAQALKVVSEAAVIQPNATRFTVHSERLNRDFEVVVQRPNAQVFLPGQKLAAIYALDGGYGMAGPQSVFLGARDVMAPAIVVSIDYPPGQAGFRATDLTHHPFTLGGETAGGGGAAFQAFLLEELKPFIEAKYPADPRGSVLFGHSLGAVFAANVFADNPDAFAGYIIGSVVVPRDPGLVERVRRAAARAHGVRVFLAVGGDEDATTSEKRQMLQGFAAMTAALKGRPGVALKARSYAGENHVSYYPQLVVDGFRFVLPPNVPVNRPYVAVPEGALAHYAGVYALPDGRAITVKPAPNSLLTAQVAGLAPVYLLPNGPDRYYAFAADLDVLFDSRGLTLKGRGAEVRAERTAPR